MARKKAEARPPRPKKTRQPAGGNNTSKTTEEAAQRIPRSPAAGYCTRPLDGILWPPRHDGTRCHAMHRELPAPIIPLDRKRTGNPLPEVRDAKQRAFLTALTFTGNITQSCRLSGVGRTAVYGWLESDPDFVKARDVALEVYADLIDEEMHARGVDGWDEPQFGKIDRDRDGIIGYVRKKSDAVLLRIAAGIRPEKYGRQLHDVRGKDGAPLGGDLAKLTEAELLVYRDLVAKMSGGGSR